MDSIVADINDFLTRSGDDIHTLEQLQRDYPASTAVRMALLKRYHETGNPAFAKLKDDTAFYATNLPWYLLVMSQFENDTTPRQPAQEAVTAPADDTQQEVAQDSTPAEHQVSAVSFDPLHTIDYFASQGIRLREEDLKDDQLSIQVRSFTGWLKSMKQLHPGRLPKQDEVIEKIIQNASESSNIASDVLTEAMAEVLVKQNKKEKAIDMYEKLSLMNPVKSAYFAAKIESLKTT